MFSVCSHLGGGGGEGVPCLHLHPIILPLVPSPFWRVPHLHPIILPLVPCPFWGYPSDWSQVRAGVPHHGVPPPGMGYPLARDGVPPVLGWGTPSQVRMVGWVPHDGGTPLSRDGVLPARSGWWDGYPMMGVPPCPGMGYSQPGQDGGSILSRDGVPHDGGTPPAKDRVPPARPVGEYPMMGVSPSQVWGAPMG